jgi:squalene synthase HpnC
MSSVFAEQLRQWGPEALESRTATPAEAEAYCRHLARTHYENFPVVTWLLPRKLRQHFYNVYAYCRWADDLGDEVAGAAESLALLGWWRNELAACYAGAARHPVFVALQRTIEIFRIPSQPFEDLITAFEQDQRVSEFETFSQLLEYCRFSANPVGRLVLYVSGAYGEQNAVWSDSICTGLQLANFWQDIGRDLDIGRVYLPAEDRARFGYSLEALAARETNPPFIELMRFEVERARDFLYGGLPLAEQMPGRLQVDIELFARGGLKILERIESIGYRVWETRPVVSKRDVAGLFAGSLLRAVRRRLPFCRGREQLGSSPRRMCHDDIAR